MRLATQTPGSSDWHVTGAGEKSAVSVNSSGREIRVLDQGTEIVYRLGRRPAELRGGFGWSETVRPGGESFACRTSEPFAVLADLGRERPCFEATRDGIRELARAGERYSRGRALALFFELRSAVEGERVSIRRLRAAVVARVADGESPAELAERGGFIRDGKPDTSRLLRRAGLVPTPASRTGRLRLARTASAEVAAMLCRACDVDPFEVGL